MVPPTLSIVPGMKKVGQPLRLNRGPSATLSKVTSEGSKLRSNCAPAIGSAGEMSTFTVNVSPSETSWLGGVILTVVTCCADAELNKYGPATKLINMANASSHRCIL